MDKNKEKHAAKQRRHKRLRQRLAGSSQRPRLSVFRSLNHTYAQIVDDSQGHTIAAASDLDHSLRRQRDGKKKTEVAALVGQTIAERARKAGIETVVFDRGGFKYHGRVKALAEAARKGGLTF